MNIRTFLREGENETLPNGWQITYDSLGIFAIVGLCILGCCAVGYVMIH